MTYRTHGTCSTQIEFSLDENHIIHDVQFTNGSNGNLQGISRLVEGRRAEDVINTLEGVRCGMKNTSCPDQLAQALKQAISA